MVRSSFCGGDKRLTAAQIAVCARVGAVSQIGAGSQRKLLAGWRGGTATWMQ